MEKSQQRVIIYYFSLKGWGAWKIEKELTNALSSDIYIHKPRSRSGLLASVSATFPPLMKVDPEDRSQFWDDHWNIS
jgi:hypothetical protein